MENLTQKAEELIERYLAGNCTEEERILVERVYLKRMLKADPAERTIDFTGIGIDSWKYIQSVINPGHVVKRKLWTPIVSAAAILLIVGVGLWFYTGKNDYKDLAQITPGKNSAVLTLANGKTISLSDAKTGVVINSSKLKYNDGTEVATSEQPSVDQRMLTVSTPRGGTYEIILPDGTKVWLNAASSLKFPSTFSNLKSRKVDLIGEAYFEVSKVNITEKSELKAKRMPFVVQSNGQQVEVLGTHFNINSYADESSIKTTLLEGSVKVTSSATSGVLLKPGEQSVVTNHNVKVLQVDTDEMVAWKNGYFKFVDEDMESIMRKIGRWYNVDIQFADPMPNEVFTGRISRSKNIGQVLKMIESANSVHFKVEGRRITVIK